MLSTFDKTVSFTASYTTLQTDVCLISMLKNGKTVYGSKSTPLDGSSGTGTVTITATKALGIGTKYALVVYTAPCGAPGVRNNFVRVDIGGIEVVLSTTSTATPEVQSGSGSSGSATSGSSG